MSAMRQSNFNLQTVVVTFFPMFIATLSLCTSIFNGYLNLKFVELVQRNTGRVEYMRTCKEIIDAYFQVKFRAGVINANAGRGAADAMSWDDVDGSNAVSKFAALGTYLANLRDDAIRAQYSGLTAEIEQIMTAAKRSPQGDFPGLFTNADRMFNSLNSDCVKTAQDAM